MTQYHTCPRCQQAISEARRLATPAVCESCGLVLSMAELKAEVQGERRFLKIAIGLSILGIAAFMQLVSWGSYAVEIIPLQIGRIFNSNSPAQLERLSVIAFESKKYDLVESSFQSMAQQDSQNYLRLAKFQMSRAKYKEASESFRQFFVHKNEDLDAHYLYARALGESGQADESAKHFEYVLRARPGFRQVTVLTYYVKMLMQNERFEQARKVIEAARTQDKTAGLFMDTEYKVITERMRARG